MNQRICYLSNRLSEDICHNEGGVFIDSDSLGGAGGQVSCFMEHFGQTPFTAQFTEATVQNIATNKPQTSLWTVRNSELMHINEISFNYSVDQTVVRASINKQHV